MGLRGRGDGEPNVGLRARGDPKAGERARWVANCTGLLLRARGELTGVSIMPDPARDESDARKSNLALDWPNQLHRTRIQILPP